MITTHAPTKIAFARILIPTDFSNPSQRALEYAQQIAREHGSRLLLMSVDEPVNPIAPPEAMWFNDEELRQQRAQQLKESESKLRSKGFQAEAVSETGSVRDEILALAAERNVDLIVMATHGRVGIERLLFGSDTESVSRQVPCPVLVIGPTALNVPAFTWPPKNVICATTLNPAAGRIAAYAYRLAHEYGADFMMFSVDDCANVIRGKDWVGFEDAFRESLPVDMAPSDPVQILFGDTPGHRIADAAKERHADLIVLGAHEVSGLASHFLRGTAPQVFTEAPCPVMTLQRRQNEG